MPKITHGEGPTADGLSGVVSDATGKQWEIDPTRNMDGERPTDTTEEESSAGNSSSTSPESTPKTSSKK